MKKRQGFTLVELLGVIVIIAILIAMLTPVLASAMRKARVSSVQQEISQLEYAIADFNAHFGMNPPSHIDLRLYDTPTSTTPNPSGAVLKPATQAILRRMWPNINMAGLIKDLQDNPTKQANLNGSACLVFFLGGVIPMSDGIPMGFSKNPRSPLNIVDASGNVITSRVGPFFEFRQERLYNDPSTAIPVDGYLDTLPGQRKPYLYLTSDRYAAQDKANADNETDSSLLRPVYRATATAYFNANKYQIVSPGFDGADGIHDTLPGGAYGVGGVFDSEEGTLTDVLDGSHTFSGLAKGDPDNITNFHSGPLIP